MSLLTLTTDFGLEDHYVGVMKGVILSIHPAVLMVDLTHAVQPQNVRQGAFLLYNAYSDFPPNTVHLAVVDPGVGTARKAICLVVPEVGQFVGPDNGLFSYIIEAEQKRGAHLSAYSLSNPTYHRPAVSHTFHGRDIFAPVAARLIQGLAPARLGEPLEVGNLVKLDKIWPQVQTKDQHRIIKGEIVHIDHFGNLISNIPATLLEELTSEQSQKLRGVIGSSSGLGTPPIVVRGLRETYGQAEKGKLVILIGSSGFVEIARIRGRADSGNGKAVPYVKIGQRLRLIVPL